MLKCEIMKFEAQDIVTASLCACHNAAGEVICNAYNSDGFHARIDGFGENAQFVFECTGPTPVEILSNKISAYKAHRERCAFCFILSMRLLQIVKKRDILSKEKFE